MNMKRRARPSREQPNQNVASIDRLSALSDSILIHVLSFLPTKLSVSTSILAKRWRFLWALVPSLRFEGEIRLDVIHRVMVLNKAKTMDTFSLSDMPHCNDYQIETLIISAIDRNVRKLHLLGFKVVLPRCLFTSETLVDLRLDKCVGILPSRSPAYLPSLRRLYLHGLKYLVEGALPNLLSACPVLEELGIIKGTVGPNLCFFNVSSPSIKRLEIEFQLLDYETPHKVGVAIKAPKLRYLKVYTSYNQWLSLSPMTSLIEADMRLYKCNLSPGKLFYWFRNLKCLKLSGGRCKFSEVAGSFVKFDCLTKIELYFSVDWDELVKFLEIADKLEVLIIHQVSNNWRNWIEPQKGCLLHSLKTLRILHFGCTDTELCLVKYVLSNAIALKRVEIFSGSSGLDLEGRFVTVTKILLFHRGSSECEVAFD